MQPAKGALYQPTLIKINLCESVTFQRHSGQLLQKMVKLIKWTVETATFEEDTPVFRRGEKKHANITWNHRELFSYWLGEARGEGAARTLLTYSSSSEFSRWDWWSDWSLPFSFGRKMSIPVVDFGDYGLDKCDVCDDRLQDLSQQLGAAFTDIGFVLLKNTGITQDEVSPKMSSENNPFCF